MFEIEAGRIEDFSDRKDFLYFISEAFKHEIENIKKNNAIIHQWVIEQNKILQKYERKTNG